MEVAIVVVIVVALCVAVPLVVARTVIRRGKARATAELATLGPLGRQSDAAFMGLRSKGAAQVRGNGSMALTADGELVFIGWAGSTDLRIDADQRLEVHTEKGWLGKRIGHDLLALTFTSEDGSEEAVAFWVDDLSGWISALE